MSWTNELEKVYELLSSDEESNILPLYHSTANSQIEISIDENGNFKSAACVDKKEAVTIIPVTEDSGARANGIYPMPLNDKLVYIAGDYKNYATGKNADNKAYFDAYMNQLKEWCTSKYTHDSVKAIYRYLEKREIMNDLIRSSVLKIDDETGILLDKEKIAGIAQEDAFVRFIVSYNKTWEDKSLYESFILYNSSNSTGAQLCYASGKELVPTYKHPSKIRNSGDKAKLISSNDENGFTYRGRFDNKEEAVSVSYEFSQKMHNALKWLAENHSVPIKSLSLIVWAETLQPVPNIADTPQNDYEEEFDEADNDDILRNALKVEFEKNLQKYLFGHGQKFRSNTKVMIMGLDSATTGRLSISLYSEIESTRFFKNVDKWHKDISWLCFNGKRKKNEISSFSPKAIANCAYGTEQNGFLDSGDQIKQVTMKLIPCISEGKKVPKDLTYALFKKASDPLAYSERYNHRMVVETACGLIKKYYIDYKSMKGEDLMAYDPNNTDRSYLFGCLIAVADKLERSTYDKELDSKRETNARRYWNAFVSRPYHMWQKIEESLLPYKSKLNPGSKVYYEKCINDIMDKFTADSFADSRGLEPMYLLGYHHYTTMLNTYNKKSEEENKK